ncbi:Uncharacterised protein [Mycobacteroides abscessus subsp. abscessus]|nr:Uncharacterised protein [Mycobacteroides abscessus subsp. abscessus]
MVSSTTLRFEMTSPIAWSRPAICAVSCAVWSKISLIVPPSP